MTHVNQSPDRRATHHVFVNVSKSFSVRPDGRRSKPKHHRFWIEVEDFQVGGCETAVGLIKDNYIRVGEREFVRLDATRTERIDARNLYIRCAVWKLTGHQDTMIDAEVYELVCRLIDQLTTVSEEDDVPPLLNGSFYDLRCDHSLSGPCGCVEEYPAVTSSD